MSKEKQIEEMAKAICSACAIRENCKLEDVCRATLQESEALYNAGYRKQSEVAREIFEEIENLSVNTVDDWGNSVQIISEIDYAELKKKYSEDKNE